MKNIKNIRDEAKINLDGLIAKHLAKIKENDPKIESFLHIDEEDIAAQVKDVKERLESEDLPLAGVPVAIKDNMVTKGIETTCASKILKGYVPPYNATVVEKLKAAGAIILGKTNLDEFAMGSSSEHSAFKTTKNPHDLSRTPGGSSSGSVASVAAGFCPASLGSDTGGSIRQPASLCGVVGIKPTYGRVSRYGLVAFASSLDQIGPVTKTTEDAALILNSICGYDPNDSTSLNVPTPDFTEDLEKDIKGLKIGLPDEYFGEGLDEEVKDSVIKAVDKLAAEGAELVKISLPNTDYAIPTYYIIAPAEASANLARYDGIRYGLSERDTKDLDELYKRTKTKGFGKEVTLRILLGTYVLSSGYYDAYYRKAAQVRTLIKQGFTEAFSKVDVILTPTTPTTAFKLGEKLDDPLKMYLSDIYTVPCNLAGLPGISIPCGKDKSNLPIGLQLMGKPLDEATILRTANRFEKISDWDFEIPKF